jgi:hypothetical protein
MGNVGWETRVTLSGSTRNSHQFRSLPYPQTLASQTLDMAVPEIHSHAPMHPILSPSFHGAGAWRRSSRHPPGRDAILVGQLHTQPRFEPHWRFSSP